MQIGNSPFEYEWISDWAEIPNSETASAGWAHHGMAVTGAGEVIAIHPAESLAMVFDQSGKLLNSFDIPVREAHQLALATVNGEESLWIADPGRKNIKTNGSYEPVQGEWGGQAVRVSLTGERLQQITDGPAGPWPGATRATSPTPRRGRASSGVGRRRRRARRWVGVSRRQRRAERRPRRGRGEPNPDPRAQG